jgi:hypothetical protein
MATPKKKSARRSEKPVEKQPTPKSQEESETLKGWTAIGAFLGLPAATAQRWARDGMPVHREGRHTTANRAELEAWLGRESNMPAPAQVVTSSTDLSEAIKQSLKAAKTQRSNK